MPKRNRKFIELPHPIAVRQHAIRRMWQRFGIAMTDAEYIALSASVLARMATPDGVTRSGNPCFRVRVRGRDVWAGWHKQHAVIATFHNGDRLR